VPGSGPGAGSSFSTCHARQLHLPLLRAKRVQFSPHDKRQFRSRRLNGHGYIKLFGHQFAVGREHAMKAVTIVLEDNVATVLEGNKVLRRLAIAPRLLVKGR
jgi:hypothetical protein